jgi:hypothetical protein
MQRDSNLLVEWSKSAEDEVGLLHNADDRSGLGLLCVRGPDLIWRRSPAPSNSGRRRLLEKIQWFVAQDQSGIRKELLCISARVRSVPCSCLVKGEVGYGVTSSARAADGLRGRRAASAARCLAADRQPPAGVAALWQAEMSLRARDPPWALLVPALARAWAAAKAVRSKGATGCHARRPRGATASASTSMVPATDPHPTPPPRKGDPTCLK